MNIMQSNLMHVSFFFKKNNILTLLSKIFYVTLLLMYGGNILV